MIKLWRYIWVCIFISMLGLVDSFSQNLVPNPGFEEFYDCPADYVTTSYKLYVTQWQSANNGTPDYFNACSKKCGVPFNWAGYAEAFEGKAYMGIVGCMLRLDPKQISYREYIKIALNEPLKTGQTYRASVKLLLAESSLAACNGMGILFSSTDLWNLQTFNFPLIPQIQADEKKIFRNKEEWEELSGNYTALGGEAYIIIGNFLSDQQINYQEFDENLLTTRHTSPMAYYLIDDVSVIGIKDTFEDDITVDNVFSGVIEPGKLLRLDHLYFETDQWKLLPESYPELDQLVNQLIKNPHWNLQIHGHADQTGSEDHNILLSQNRAKQVKEYLISKGIFTNRILYFGHGSSQPADTASGQGSNPLNRRVEVVVE